MPPRGTGVENIRECIIESKMTFDVSSDDWQAYLKAKIMNNIERYFYLIVFAMYIRELGPKGFPQTFKEYMEANSGLRTMIAEVKIPCRVVRVVRRERIFRHVI